MNRLLTLTLKRAAVVLAMAILALPAHAQMSGLSARLANDSGRPDADKARDEGRKPVEVLEFLGIETGMTVIDLVAAAGYYSEVLSHAVGPSGKVYMQNAPFSGERGERTKAAIDARLAGNRLSNIEQLITSPDSLGLPDNSIDAAVIALEFHELYLSDNPDAVSDFLQEMRRVLKPGGVLGVIEHAGYPVYDPGPLHRALEAQVVADAQAAGMFVQASGKMLRNIEDDRTAMVFAADIRGKTDRFVLRILNK